MNATWIQFKDGKLALQDDKELSIYDDEEDGAQIGRRDYDLKGKLRFCWLCNIPVWLNPTRYGQKKKVGRCAVPRTAGLYWDSAHRLHFVEPMLILGKLRPASTLEGNSQHRRQIIGYIVEETEGLPPGCVRHVIIDTEGRETFCQCFDAEGLLYRQFTERHEGGRFVSARRAERQPDGSYRVFACDELGQHLSEDELPQDIADTWPVGYAWRSPEEAEPLPYPS